MPVWLQLEELFRRNQHLCIVHGACPTGADKYAHEWVAAKAPVLPGTPWILLEEQHPADWHPNPNNPTWLDYGAGPKRNTKVAELGADYCIAFLVLGLACDGTWDMIRKATRVGIETHIFVAKNPIISGVLMEKQ